MLSFKEIATLLCCSAGLIYPSAGARYPIEIYLASMKIEELKQGLYHYDIKHHCLEKLLETKEIKKIILGVTGQAWVKKSAAIIIMTTAFHRNEIKYGERAFRYSLIEAGHIGQNIYLISSALNLNCCAIGGFLDEEINSLIDLDPEQEIVLYLIALGK